jgi:dTDP-4-amino-4,6-dideoxy-D-galactose acyltransferase
MIQLEQLLESKKNDLIIYSPYNFINELEPKAIVEGTVIESIINEISSNVLNVIKIEISGKEHFFFIKHLDWDTNYFGFPSYRIELILYDHNELFILSKAINKFIELSKEKSAYYFINIPCEDILLIQAMCKTKFKLIETRLNYYLHDVKKYMNKKFSVREAKYEDIEILKNIAIKMRNKYDRVHADPAFTSNQADNYLGKFLEESFNGFADILLVPDVPQIEPFGFLIANKPKDILGINVSKLVLAAIDNTIMKGWFYKLLDEMINKVKEFNADYLTTITQASNKAAIRTWEKAGFKLGYTTHIFSFKNDD